MDEAQEVQTRPQYLSGPHPSACGCCLCKAIRMDVPSYHEDARQCRKKSDPEPANTATW